MHEKIGPHHLEREAIFYVRQPSADQVLQYAMRDRLVAFGWSSIEIIENDLGAIHAGRRLGPECRSRQPVLHEVREAGLLTFQTGTVQIHDLDALMELADFNVAYLDHDGPLIK